MWDGFLLEASVQECVLRKCFTHGGSGTGRGEASFTCCCGFRRAILVAELAVGIYSESCTEVVMRCAVRCELFLVLSDWFTKRLSFSTHVHGSHKNGLDGKRYLCYVTAM